MVLSAKELSDGGLRPKADFDRSRIECHKMRFGYLCCIYMRNANA